MGMKVAGILVVLFVGCLQFAACQIVPDTSDGIHFMLTFDTPILHDYLDRNLSIASRNYTFIWGGSSALLPMYRATNPRMTLSKYIPFSRDPDAQPLSWWQANHPSWVLYACDKRTPASLAGLPHIVLDITNPDVIAWQIANYVVPAAAEGYTFIAADNFALGNAVNACGIWNNNVWKAKYTSDWWDEAYYTDVTSWLQKFHTQLHALATPMNLGINFVIGSQSPTDSLIQSVTNNVDAIVDEAGFTNWGEGLNDEATWLNILNYIELLQTSGKAFFSINEWVTVTNANKEYAVASYLMSRNNMCSIMVTTVQGYGVESYLPEYDALNIGKATGAKYKSGGVWWRTFTRGVAIVNAGTTALSVSLGNTAYVNAYGTSYAAGSHVSMPAQSGMVLAIKTSTSTTGTPATTGTQSTTAKSTTGTATTGTATTGTASTTAKATTGTATTGTPSTTAKATTGTQTTTGASTTGTPATTGTQSTTAKSTTGTATTGTASTTGTTTGSTTTLGPNLVLNPSFESGTTSWIAYGKGFTSDSTSAQSGTKSIKCVSTTTTATYGAYQVVTLNQAAAAPVTISGYGKTSAALTNTDTFGIYADLLLMDNTWVYGLEADFTAVNSWQQVTFKTNAKAIQSVWVYCLFRNMKGTVWFDNVYVGVATSTPASSTGAAAQAPTQKPRRSLPLEELARNSQQGAAQEDVTQEYAEPPGRNPVGIACTRRHEEL